MHMVPQHEASNRSYLVRLFVSWLLPIELNACHSSAVPWTLHQSFAINLMTLIGSSARQLL